MLSIYICMYERRKKISPFNVGMNILTLFERTADVLIIADGQKSAFVPLPRLAPSAVLTPSKRIRGGASYVIPIPLVLPVGSLIYIHVLGRSSFKGCRCRFPV